MLFCGFGLGFGGVLVIAGALWVAVLWVGVAVQSLWVCFVVAAGMW